MGNKLVYSILTFCSNILNITFGKELLVFFISCTPVLELRGGLLAATLLHLKPLSSFIICILGNLLPLPFIIWFITPIFSRMKKTRFLRPIVEKLENNALAKQEQIEKYKFWGLMIFVAIPLPGTGGWTGALIAAIMGMDKRQALVSTSLGVIIAGMIMMLVSFGFIGGILN